MRPVTACSGPLQSEICPGQQRLSLARPCMPKQQLFQAGKRSSHRQTLRQQSRAQCKLSCLAPVYQVVATCAQVAQMHQKCSRLLMLSEYSSQPGTRTSLAVKLGGGSSQPVFNSSNSFDCFVYCLSSSRFPVATPDVSRHCYVTTWVVRAATMYVLQQYSESTTSTLLCCYRVEP